MRRVVSSVAFVGDQAVFCRRVTFGSKILRTLDRAVPSDLNGMAELISELTGARLERARRAKSHDISSLGPYVPGRMDINERWRQQDEVDATRTSACQECTSLIDRTLRSMEECIAAAASEDLVLITADSQHFAIHDHCLWSSRRALTTEQWLGLIGQTLRREESKIAASVLRYDAAAKRPPIPSEVRAGVWQRDGGKCVLCGSRERLEFDHIIPLAMGGGNTARNIELLCESCNRSKGAALS